MNRFVETVRHLSLRQIATRAVRIAERRWWRLIGANAPVSAAAPAVVPHPALWRGLRPDDAATSRAREIVDGRFTFLSETRVHPSWDAPGASRLWRFHLHSFDYARDLAAAGEADAFHALADSWMNANRRLDGDGWHPYTISLRLVNWCEASLVLGGNDRLHASIDAQARFLARHLERDVRGNHLLENARALIRAGAFFGDSGLTARGVAVLRAEVPEQVLGDGGHFERTPGYHVRVLEVLEDAAVYVDEPWLRDAIARMHEFLEVITGPEGRLPLIKDTEERRLPASRLPFAPSRLRVNRISREAAKNAKGVREAGSLRSQWLSDSGFFVVRHLDDFLIADFGRVCPDYLPAHAHADMFSFELTIGGRPVIVDSGVYEYEEGPWRNWFRSTAAHNTVEVDGRDQSEMWGSFRVGRRARAGNVTWSDDGEVARISGQHDGYAPVIHHRAIVADRRRRQWIVLDRLSGPPGHTVRSRIHLHPDSGAPRIAPFGGATLSEEQGWYSERFGEKRANRVLVLTCETPATIGYVIAADEDTNARIGEGNVVEVTDGAGTSLHRFP